MYIFPKSAVLTVEYMCNIKIKDFLFPVFCFFRSRMPTIEFQYHYTYWWSPEILHPTVCGVPSEMMTAVRCDATSLFLSFFSAYDATVPAGRQALIKTDLSIAIPSNTYARIAPRSGLAVKKMIDVGAGVVDYDYRGPVGVVLFNHGSEDFKVNKGDRVAQLILERICMAEIKEVCSGPVSSPLLISK